MKQPKYTIGLKFKGKPYRGYSEIHVNSLNQVLYFPTSQGRDTIVTHLVINNKSYKFKDPMYVYMSVQPYWKKGALYKILRNESLPTFIPQLY